MIATAILISNAKEVLESREEKKRLDLPNYEEIKPVLVEREFLFALTNMQFAFLNDEGNIKTIICGQEIIFKYNQEIYDRLKEHFKHN